MIKPQAFPAIPATRKMVVNQNRLFNIGKTYKRPSAWNNFLLSMYVRASSYNTRSSFFSTDYTSQEGQGHNIAASFTNIRATRQGATSLLSGPYSNNSVNHVTFLANGSELQLFINKQLAQTGSLSGSYSDADMDGIIARTTSTLTMGVSMINFGPYSEANFNRVMNEVRMQDDWLYCPCDEGSGDTIHEYVEDVDFTSSGSGTTSWIDINTVPLP